MSEGFQPGPSVKAQYYDPKDPNHFWVQYVDGSWDEKTPGGANGGLKMHSGAPPGDAVLGYTASAGPTGGQTGGGTASYGDITGASAGSAGPNAALASVDPNKYKMLQMHLGALADQAYRPEMAAARTRALQSQMEAYKPMQNVMGAMYGPQGQIDMTKATQNPLTQAMMRLGAPNRNDIGLAPPGSPNAAGYRQGPVGNAASAAAPVTYPDASITLGPPPPAPAGLHRGPDGKLYDAQGRLVSG